MHSGFSQATNLKKKCDLGYSLMQSFIPLASAASTPFGQLYITKKPQLHTLTNTNVLYKATCRQVYNNITETMISNYYNTHLITPCFGNASL